MKTKKQNAALIASLQDAVDKPPVDIEFIKKTVAEVNPRTMPGRLFDAIHDGVYVVEGEGTHYKDAIQHPDLMALYACTQMDEKGIIIRS